MPGRCCFQHDCCYGRAERAGCQPKTEVYHWECEDNAVVCGEWTLTGSGVNFIPRHFLIYLLNPCFSILPFVSCFARVSCASAAMPTHWMQFLLCNPHLLTHISKEKSHLQASITTLENTTKNPLFLLGIYVCRGIHVMLFPASLPLENNYKQEARQWELFKKDPFLLRGKYFTPLVHLGWRNVWHLPLIACPAHCYCLQFMNEFTIKTYNFKQWVNTIFDVYVYLWE